MKVSAMLSWYDEDPADLHAAVSSCAGICDRVVALDGGYALVEGARPSSETFEHDAIRDAAADAGLELELFVPRSTWPGQCAKRSALFELAAGEPGWLVYLDADWRLGSLDPVELRKELRRAHRAGVEVLQGRLLTPEPAYAYSPASEWHASVAGTATLYPSVLRAMPGMRVERLHWYVSGLRGADRVALRGYRERPGYLQPVERVLPDELFEAVHLCLFRDERSAAYLRNRELVAAVERYVAVTGCEP